METTTAVKSAAWKPKQAEPVKLQKRIGSTTYVVSVCFSATSKETLEDKILRLARNNGLDFQSENADPLRTSRLPERSKAS